MYTRLAVAMLLGSSLLTAAVAEPRSLVPAQAQSHGSAESQGSDDDKFSTECKISRGDSLDKVKEFYRIPVDPQRPSANTQLTYQYHLERYGVWVFFDDRKQVSSVRFDAPFRGRVGKVAIGDNAALVLSSRGSLTNQAQGMINVQSLNQREQQVQSLLQALPDPVPKSKVMEAVAQIDKIRNAPFKFNTAWIYILDKDKREYVRYEIGPDDNTVQTILVGASECP